MIITINPQTCIAYIVHEYVDILLAAPIKQNVKWCVNIIKSYTVKMTILYQLNMEIVFKYVIEYRIRIKEVGNKKPIAFLKVIRLGTSIIIMYLKKLCDYLPYNIKKSIFFPCFFIILLIFFLFCEVTKKYKKGREIMMNKKTICKVEFKV